MNNLIELKYQEKFNYVLENSSIYIMDNSELYKYDGFSFNINGEIDDPQTNLNKKNLTLIINTENEEKPEAQVQCNLSNISRINYILNCKANETFKGQLQNALSFIDDNNILLLNFPNKNESIINIEKNQNNRRYFLNNNRKGLGAGTIVGITIPIVVLIALIIFLIFCLSKRNKKLNDNSESSINKLKISDEFKN